MTILKYVLGTISKEEKKNANQCRNLNNIWLTKILMMMSNTL